MEFLRTERFTQDEEQLPVEVRQQLRDKFELLKDNPEFPYHPSLRIKKMQGHDNIWEGHIYREIVFTFHREINQENGEIRFVFRRIGTHDVYKKP